MKFFRMYLKSTFVYRFEVIVKILSSIMVILISFMLWESLYRDNANMSDYMKQYIILSSIVNLFYLKNIGIVIGKKIRDGSFAIDLLRPVNPIILIWQQELASLLTTMLIQGAPIAAFFLPVLTKIEFSFQMFYGLIFLVLGHILFFLLFLFVGLLAIIFVNVEFYNRILNDTIKLLAGGVIPLSIFPEKIKKITFNLPFRYLYSFPIELFLGNATNISRNFYILLFWILLFGFMDYIVYKSVMKRITIAGG